MRYWIGIDVGGTNIVCGLLDENMRVMGVLKRSTDASSGAEGVMDRLAGMIEELLNLKGVKHNEIVAVGAGIPGLIDPDRGVCRFAGNLGWNDYPVSSALSSRVHIPVFIDNDVRMFSLGEAVEGAGRGYDVVMGVTLGTGIAAGIVSGGRLYYGGGYMAGEIGHIKMEGLSDRCGCGLYGCLETVASATGIVRLAQKKLAAGRTSMLAGAASDAAHLSAAHVSAAYDQGDPVAIEVLREVGGMLGKGLATAVTLFSPDAIVIGGGAAQAGERIFAPMRETLQQHLLPMYWERLQIRTSQLMDHAGLVGSAVNARNRCQSAIRGRFI